MGPIAEEEPLSDAVDELSLLSNRTEAKEYVSEKALGINGIFPRKPHLWPIDGSDEALESKTVTFGRSKICSVDLSEVAARKLLSGEILIEKTVAGSTPRRSSAILAQLLVENTFTSVP